MGAETPPDHQPQQTPVLGPGRSEFYIPRGLFCSHCGSLFGFYVGTELLEIVRFCLEIDGGMEYMGGMLW